MDGSHAKLNLNHPGIVMQLTKDHTARISAFLLQLALLIVVFTTLLQSQTPAGYWSFDEGEGASAADLSGQNHTATLVNGVRWVSGRMGGAISADASASQYAKTSAIDLSGTKVVTVAFWSKRNYTKAARHALITSPANYVDSATGFAFYPDDAICGGIQVALKGDIGQTANCYDQPTSGVWHHFAIVFDKRKTGGNQIALFVDGHLQPVSRSLYATTNTNNFGINPIYFFSQGGTGLFDSGRLDDVRLYAASLSAGQVQRLYELGSAQIGKDFVVSVDGNGTMTTATLTTSVNQELLVAFVTYDGPSSSQQTATVSGGGLTWTLRSRSNQQHGTSEVWAAIAPNAPFSTTVTSHPGSSGYDGSLTVIGFTHASGTGVVGHASASSGAPDVSLPGISAGNWVFASGNDWDNAIARTPVSGQVLAHQRIDTQTGDTYWLQSTGAPSTSTGSVDIHDTAPTADRWNYAAVEIVASTGTQGTLSASPTSLNFGNVSVNTSSSLSVTLANTGVAPVTVSTLSISGAEFSLSTVSTPFTLQPGKTTQLTAQFKPTIVGPATGQITITSNATNPSLSIPLTGAGVSTSQGTLTPTPASLNFGSVNVSTSSSLSLTITNTGNASVTVSNISVAGAEFSISSVTTPFTLAAGNSTQLTATFSPTITGSASGTITVTSNATNATLSIPLSGTGITTVQHLVTLAWDASTSQVIGYNVYRSTSVNGTFVLLNTGLITSTAYVDQAVQSGYTYYYYATAVDSQYRESVASNEVAATVP